MSQSLQEKRWVENELVFRQHNERVVKDLASTQALAEETNQRDFVKGFDNLSLLFYCECAHEDCHERIPLTPKEYADKHQNKSQFMLKPGHNIPQVERIVYDGGHYLIVEKFISPPAKAEKLHPTK